MEMDYNSFITFVYVYCTPSYSSRCTCVYI